MGTVILFIAFGASAALLARVVGRFRREWREAEVARGPAIPEQSLSIPVAGGLSFFLEGPRFRTWSKWPVFFLTDPSTGRAIPVRPTYSGAGVRSARRSRVERGRFALERPGSYLVRVEGLRPADRDEYAVVIMRPFTQKLLAFILSIVLLSLIVIGSFVGVILTLAL